MVGSVPWTNAMVRQASMQRIADDPNPVSQNWDLAHMPFEGEDTTANDTPWGKYARVLAHRGAQILPQAAARPSLSALRGSSGGYSYTDYDPATDPNSRVFAPTFEQARQAGVIADADAAAGRNLAIDRATNAAAFDLNARAPQRAQAMGDINRSEGRQNVRAAAETYFDPAVRARREAEFADQMAQLRQRYSDPAMLRAQSALEEARIRGAYGVARESTAGRNALSVQELRNAGAQDVANTAARARIGAGVAAMGQPADQYAPAAPSSETLPTTPEGIVQELRRVNPGASSATLLQQLQQTIDWNELDEGEKRSFLMMLGMRGFQ